MGFLEYTNKTADETLEMLETSVNGLSEKEVVLRQKKFGLNEIKSGRFSFLDIFIRQFKSPFFYLLFFAGITSTIIGEVTDSIVILLFVMLNVIIGFFQEFRAEKSLLLLKKFVPQKSVVIRNNKEVIIQKEQLVVGDIILVKSGDIIPADARILELDEFLVDESILTGESVANYKKSEPLIKQESEIFRAENIIFTGTSVISGRVKAVVVCTGKDTSLGQIAKMLSGSKRAQSSYEKNLYYFSKLVLKIVIFTIALIFIINVILNGTENIFDFSLFCIALIVSILPEALPAVVTFSLTRGSLKMAKENVVVRRLSAIEDLGNIEILCTDKTGTLTQNRLSLEKIVSSDKNKMFLYSLFNPDSQFDSAIYKKAGKEIIEKAKNYKIISKIPFNSNSMTSGYLAEDNRGQRILVIKGAPESVLKICSRFSNDFEKKEIKEDIEKDGQAGKRALAVAYRKIELKDNLNKKATQGELFSKKETDQKGLTFLGYFVFSDPLKSTAEESIKEAKNLGVTVKIITGDSREVAGFVAKKIGLIKNQSNVISGFELEKMFKDDFDNACNDFLVFARISPDLKYKIIKSLQKRYDVAFMGEGVNDAPALKVANVGIAVKEATDIARESSDVVLLDKDLRVVIDGIKNGRKIFVNINKYIKCALASNFGNFYSIAVISLFVNFLPMLPVQILLGNLLSDFPLISIATDSVDTQELSRPKMYQLHTSLPLIVLLAFISTIFDFIFFSVFLKNSPGTIQTLWFIESILTEILLIFIIRTRGPFWKAKKPSLSLMLFTAIDGLFIILLPFLSFGKDFLKFQKPPIGGLLMVLFLVANYFIVSEVAKLFYFKFKKTQLD